MNTLRVEAQSTVLAMRNIGNLFFFFTIQHSLSIINHEVVHRILVCLQVRMSLGYGSQMIRPHLTMVRISLSSIQSCMCPGLQLVFQTYIFVVHPEDDLDRFDPGEQANFANVEDIDQLLYQGKGNQCCPILCLTYSTVQNIFGALTQPIAVIPMKRSSHFLFIVNADCSVAPHDLACSTTTDYIIDSLM